MVFFANSGAGTLSEARSERAASTALEAASEAWRVLSRLENRVGKWGQKTEDLAHSSARKFRIAAEHYDQISRNLRPSDTFDLRALAGPARVPFGFDQIPANGLPAVPAKELYQQFSKRMRILAKMLDNLRVRDDKYAFRETAFDIMQEWETISAIARIIAAGNVGQGPTGAQLYAE